jgi:hypothetical protein
LKDPFDGSDDDSNGDFAYAGEFDLIMHPSLYRFDRFALFIVLGYVCFGLLKLLAL